MRSDKDSPMRKIFLHIIVSLDGFIEGPNKELDWQFADDEFEEYINGVLRSIDQMIFGRKAFELLADYWPTAAETLGGAADPEKPARHIEAARMMNEKTKIVFSKTLKQTQWANSRIVGGDLEDEVARLKREPGRDIALFAGAGLAQSFMQPGLLDEYRLLVNPVLIGAGTPLFAGGHRSQLALQETRSFASGAVLLVYRPKG
jgi:dihydrofolate reductase